MTPRFKSSFVAALLLMSSVAAAQQSVSLLSPSEPNFGWTYDNGREFGGGAAGKLSIDPTAKQNGQDSLRLDGDFSKAGKYVQAACSLPEEDIGEISFFLRYPGRESLTLRIIDATGQCHQINLKIPASDNWQQIVFPLKEFFDKRGTSEAVTMVGKYESWGGAKDGKWHGPGKSLVLIVGTNDKTQTQSLWINQARVMTQKAAAAPAGKFKADFESSDALNGWSNQGQITLDAQSPFKGSHSLQLSRSLPQLDQPCVAVSPTFALTPGNWDISLGVKSDLKSPDASFNGVVTLELLSDGGKVVDTVTLADLFGQKNWQPVTRRLTIPGNVTAARFRTQLNKSTGSFWLDDLSAVFAGASAKAEKRIDRIVFDTAQMGNMLYPDDPRTVNVRVESVKALPINQRELSFVVRDYWGAACSTIGKVSLTPAKKNGERMAYAGVIDLSGVTLEVGRYYELHADIDQPGDEPFHNYTSFAILPKAVTKDFKPEQIPFTSRTWDNRITEYFYLTDRLGVRICGVWGGWEKEPPYKPHAPGIDNCEKLGMGVLTGTMAHQIEHHDGDWQRITPEILKGGVRSWISKYGNVRPLIINLGNEPPLAPDRVKPNIAAYRAVYEEVKAIDPSITVVGSSMGPEEMYFQNGFQNYCDAYDFHVYEDYRNIRGTLAKYEEMFKKYGGRKPIWSTEVGLNSQGMARQAVAAEVTKKITSFFAGGGANVSWFGLIYPDPDAKGHDSSSSAHNMFDCRYSKYAPKLDAIAYYNIVNGLCVKKFTDEKVYDGGINAFLFRDSSNRAMQVFWKDKGRSDVQLPLAGVNRVTLIDIDGRRSELDAAGKSINLTVNEDPLIVLYDGGADKLPATLPQADVTVVEIPSGIIKGGSATLSVTSKNKLNVELAAPAFWDVTTQAAGDRMTFNVRVPEASTAREGNFVLRTKDAAGKLNGELRLRVPVTGLVAIRTLPVPPQKGQQAGVRLEVKNYASTTQDVTWRLALTGEVPIENGRFKPPVPTSAYFASAAEGTLSIAGRGTSEVVVPIANMDPLMPYRVRASVTDSAGRTIAQERPIGGCAIAPRATGPIKLDGSMTEPDWQRASVQKIYQRRQYMAYKPDVTKWNGEQDLSATVQFLWDAQYLYVGVKVVDDVFVNNEVDGNLWAGDGLQFLIDPCRESSEKPGKYDIAMAVTQKGPQVWSYLSADAGSPVGEVKDIILSSKRLSPQRGDMNYVVAIPWHRIAPFKPSVGANLGLAMVMNEDDGNTRQSFMGWFGDCDAKQVDAVGDIILTDTAP